MGTELYAIASLVIAAVGTGVQYSAAQSAAKTQSTFNALNASSQAAQASMQARLASAQAALTAQESANQQAAGLANAGALKLEAEQSARESQINIARQMEEQRQFQSMLRAKGGSSGTVMGGSQLDRLARSAELQAIQNGEAQYQTVQQQRQLFREAQGQELGAEYAGIQSDIDLMTGQAQASAYRAQGAQARIQGLAGVSAARGASLAALGGAITGFSGVASSAYSMQRMGAFRWGNSATAGSALGSASPYSGTIHNLSDRPSGLV